MRRARGAEQNLIEREARRAERLVVVVCVAALAFNYPLLELFSGPYLLLGVPLLYFYLFIIWALIILCVSLIMRGDGVERPEDGSRK